MYYEGRRNGIAAMCIIWSVVPIVAAYCLLNEFVNTDIILYVGISAAFNTIAIVFFAGNYKIMSGFSTMSVDELSKYNLEKVTWYSGVYFFVIGIILLPISIVFLIYYGNLAAALTIVTVVITIMIIWAIDLSFNKKYRNEPRLSGGQ